MEMPYGGYLERGVVLKVTAQGARVASFDRPGIVTKPLKALFRKTMEAGWNVLFMEFENGNGVVLSHLDPDVSRDDILSGKSAYQVWLDAENTGTVEDYLASLIGPVGADGQNGPDGKSAYEVWLDAGHTGTVEDYLASLIGPAGADGQNGTDGQDGADGKSAYQIWLDAGNTGTVEAYLAATKGPSVVYEYPTEFYAGQLFFKIV